MAGTESIPTAAGSKAAAQAQAFAGLRKDLRELPSVVMKISLEAAGEVAQKLRDNIIFTYGVKGQPALSTMKRRQFGKTAGKTPAVPPAPAGPALKQTGKLLSAIKLRKERNGWVVEVADKQRAAVAIIQEKGASWTFFPTPEAFAYILMIFNPSLRGGPGRAAKRGRFRALWSPPAIHVTIPARPVWQPEFERAASLLPGILLRRLREGFAKFRFFRGA